MFKLQAEPTFWATVSVSVPGQQRPASFEAEFRWLGKDALRDFFTALEGKKDEDALAEIMVNWRGVDGEFNRENLALMLDAYPQSALAIFTRFREELLAAKEKN